MSVMTAMPFKHVSLWSVREGGRALLPQRRAIGCVLLPPVQALSAGRGP